MSFLGINTNPNITAVCTQGSTEIMRKCQLETDGVDDDLQAPQIIFFTLAALLVAQKVAYYAVYCFNRNHSSVNNIAMVEKGEPVIVKKENFSINDCVDRNVTTAILAGLSVALGVFTTQVSRSVSSVCPAAIDLLKQVCFSYIGGLVNEVKNK